MANVELVDVNSCKKNLLIEIPADVAQKEYDRLTREFARHVKIPGFRPGKTPLSIVKKRFHAEIKQHLIQDMIPRYYQEAIQEKKLKPISEPLLDRVDFEEGTSLRFQATIEILPQLRIEGYRGLRSTVQRAAITPEGIENGLKSVQEQNARFVPIEDRPSQAGDYVTVNLAGKLADGSGIAFQDKNVIILLGDADTVSGFTESLSGLQAGGKRNFTIQYPEDFQGPRLAGKAVAYEADVVAVKEKRLPEIDDDLAREAGDFASLEEMRQAIARNLEAAAAREYEAQVRTELLQQVISQNSFEVPDSMVEGELRSVFQRVADEMAQQGIDASRTKIDWKSIAEENRPRALERARHKLALAAIADQESLQVADEELDAEVKRLADQAHKTPEALRATLTKEDRLEDLRHHLRQKKAYELIREQAIT